MFERVRIVNRTKRWQNVLPTSLEHALKRFASVRTTLVLFRPFACQVAGTISEPANA